MGKRSDILLVGQTPPPYHGQAVVTAMLFDHNWGEMKVEKLRMAFSDDMESVGDASWMKVWRLISLVLMTWKVVLTRRPRVLYYLPASPNMTPVIRDVLYLGLVRCLFPHTVFHYHAGGLDGFYQRKRLLCRLTKWVYDSADYSVDVNRTEPPSGEYFKAQNNVVVMNGLDVGEAKRQRPQGGIFQVLYVGLLCEPKGVLGLPETAQRLREAGCQCEFVMVGGWESDAFKSEFEGLISTLGVADMFKIEGIKKGAEKWQAYADADAFIFPSHHPTETFGLVLIEAMAFGLPIVTNKWRGIPNVVGGSGLAKICDVKSPCQYAEALLEVANSTETRHAMGEASRHHYVTHYTREHFVTSMEKLFEDVLKG